MIFKCDDKYTYKVFEKIMANGKVDMITANFLSYLKSSIQNKHSLLARWSQMLHSRIEIG